MLDAFTSPKIGHIACKPNPGKAAYEVLSKQDFATAWDEITAWDGYAPTPLHALSQLTAQIGVGGIAYKHEGPRFGLGSFKALGGSYAAMRVLQRELTAQLGHAVSLGDIRKGIYRDACAGITLVSATDGNHGRSLAWGCQRVGARCRTYIHAEVSKAREEAMQSLGAEVIRIDGDYDASVHLATQEAADNGWFVVSDTSWPGYTEPPRDVMAGYGVMTREICNELDQAPTHVFLQGGVGGLAASVAAGLRQHYGDKAPRVVIVEPDLAACLYASARSGEATNVTIEDETIMAGLSCGMGSPAGGSIRLSDHPRCAGCPNRAVVGKTCR